MQIDPFARTHQRLRPPHHSVNKNDRWVMLHIYEEPTPTSIALSQSSGKPHSWEVSERCKAFDRFALGAVARSCLVEKRLLDEIAIVINEVRRAPFSL